MRDKPLSLTHLLVFCAGFAAATGFASAEDLIAGPALKTTTDEPWTGIHLGVGIGARLSDAVWTTDCLAPVALPATCPNNTFGGGTRIGNDNPASFDNAAP